MNLTDIKTIQSLMNRHGVKFNKSLGQNFLINPEVCPKMAELSGIDKNAAVIEIGPGAGVLTRELSRLAGKVIALEVDAHLLPVLAESLSDCPNTEVILTDVLKTDLHRLIEEKTEGRPIYVCANLPYYITSPILMYLLESRLPLEAITVMVQKEAADRLCAPVGSRASGAITVAVSYYAEAKFLFGVPRTSFLPAPHVDSAVLRLDLRKDPAVSVSDEAFFFQVVKAVFAQRRKTALNGLSSGLSLPKTVIAEALAGAGLSEDVRAESLTMEQLALLAECITGCRR